MSFKARTPLSHINPNLDVPVPFAGPIAIQGSYQAILVAIKDSYQAMIAILVAIHDSCLDSTAIL